MFADDSLQSNVFDRETTEAQTVTFDQLKQSFEGAYRGYLRMKALRDEPVVRAGFYSIAQFVVSHEPLGDVTVQQKLLEWIESQRFGAMKNEMRAVDLLIADETRKFVQ